VSRLIVIGSGQILLRFAGKDPGLVAATVLARGGVMDIHFDCVRCARCCNHLKIPLTAAEAVDWLNRGHPVQLICDATWPPDLPTDDPQAAYRQRRSFAAMSGSMPTRVAVMLAANVAGACPNLLPDMRCGIYERRPLVCRIYPAEINPFIALEPRAKACPPEAWSAQHPLLQRNGAVMDESVRRSIQRSRDTIARETAVRLRLCAALEVMDTALAEEGFVVHSPAIAALLPALCKAMSPADAAPLPGQWRFVSNQSATLAGLTGSGAVAIHARAAGPGPEYLGFKSESPVP
jgi:Fe-S-cluster containining protein